MSFPAFVSNSKLADNTITTQSSIIRVINNLLVNLQQIFTSLLNRVQLDSLVLQNVQLVSGQNTITHTLGRTLSGWKIVRQRSAGSIYDQQDTNPSPNTTLILISTDIVSIDLEVF